MRPALPGVVLATLLTATVPSEGSRPRPADPMMGEGSREQAAAAVLRFTTTRAGFQIGGPRVSSAHRSQGGMTTELFDLEGRSLARVQHSTGGSAPRIVNGDGAEIPATSGALGTRALEGAALTWRGLDGSTMAIEVADALEIRGETEPRAASSPSDEVEASAESFRFALLPNLPNPFHATTAIRFALPQPGKARVTVFDVAGRQVARVLDETLPAGPASVDFRPRTRAPGRYELRLEFAPSDGSPVMRATRSIVLLP